MKIFFRIFRHTIFFTFLTLLTQIGGLVWLLSLGINHFAQKRWSIKGLRWGIFFLLYTLTTILVVPPIARICFDRVPLPVFSNSHLEPENLFFSFFNRTYVKSGFRKTLEEVAEQMQEKFPGSAIWFMDANFPFIDGYPLEPHLSHRDGKKIDLSFYWKSVKAGVPISKNPSPTGYGLWAEPLPGEFDYAQHCIEKGNWFIGYDEQLGNWGYDKKDYTFDGARTREMLRLLVEHPAIDKILIQPHLKKRLDLEGYNKVRAQGCHAARHDDHVHVQWR
jgi:hypothetical protein